MQSSFFAYKGNNYGKRLSLAQTRYYSKAPNGSSRGFPAVPAGKKNNNQQSARGLILEGILLKCLMFKNH
jgi:hypothetical protein